MTTGGRPLANGPRASARSPSARSLATAAALVALSLAVRWAAFEGLEAERARPLYDEAGYYEQALGFAGIWSAAVRGEPPLPDARRQAYRGGVWPPGHPAALGLVLAWLPPSVPAARLVVLVLSVLTTPLVWLVTRRLAGEPAALVAGAAHALYPGFVAFAHLLWSETTFILCALVAVAAALALGRTERAGRRLAAAALLGLAVGACVLVRVAALPWLLLAPVWPLLALPRGRGRIAAALLVGLLSLAAVAPWQRALSRAEGGFVLLSTAGGYNLLLGAGADADKPEVRAAVAARAREAGTNRDAAARQLAWEQIRRHPAAYLAACVRRASSLWQGDQILFRHLLRAVYPPRSEGIAGTVIAATLAAQALLLAAAAWGIARWPRPARPEGILLLVAIASLLAPALLTVANSRMALPALALALPFAGHGAVRMAGGPARGRALAVLVAVVCAYLLNLRAGASLASLEPSSHYRGLVAAMDDWYGSRTAVSDCVELRARPGGRATGALLVELRGGYRLRAGRDAREVRWQPLRRPRLRLRVVGERPEGALELALTPARTPGRTVLVHPTEPEGWASWRPSGVRAVEVRWCGGGRGIAD